ncbi:MAG: PRC-barrel domain containing protein [bacterium]
MHIAFGTRVVDSDGKAVGTVRYLVLHPHTQQIDGLVVHQGVVRSREMVVPMAKVAGADSPIRLALRAVDLESLSLFNPEHLRPMPDHWNMPVGFDERDLFMVGGGGWMESTLPFAQTSSAVSGTPTYIEDKDSAQDPAEFDIARGMAVYDSTGRRVGDVESVDFAQASGKITWIVVRGGHLFGRDTTIPASLITSINDRITLSAPAGTVKKLESQ